MSSPTSEIDRLDPVPTPITLVSGLKVDIQRLKLRQLFRLLRIITRGGAQYLPMLREAFMTSDDDERSEAVGIQLMAIAIIALPEAENEAIDFLRSVIEPSGMPVGSDKATKAAREQAYDALDKELANPEPEDAIAIIEAVVDREKSDLAALGKRVGTAISMMTKTGQLKDLEEKANAPTGSSVQTIQSPVLSQESSTSSPPSTDGQTN
jgi:hypothetical protein